MWILARPAGGVLEDAEGVAVAEPLAEEAEIRGESQYSPRAAAARVDVEGGIAPRQRRAHLAGERLAPGVEASPVGGDNLLDGRRVLDGAVGDGLANLVEPGIAEVVGIRGAELPHVQHRRAGAVEAQHAADGEPEASLLRRFRCAGSWPGCQLAPEQGAGGEPRRLGDEREHRLALRDITALGRQRRLEQRAQALVLRGRGRAGEHAHVEAAIDVRVDACVGGANLNMGSGAVHPVEST